MEKIYTGCFADRLVLEEPQTDLFLKLEKRASGSLQVFAGDVRDLTLHIEAGEYSYVKLFFQTRTQDAVRYTITGHIGHDAKLQFGFLDMSDVPVEVKLKLELDEQGATAEWFSGQLCVQQASKRNDLEINHHSPYTYGNMHNFAVTFDGGFYDCVAAGRICNGCYNSESHQETRVLTMGTDHTAKVIPILYIDENDVKASHALTIGQPDEQQLYYLQSRGLSKEQAVGLLSIGYFMPVIDLIDDEHLHEELRTEMERRVGLYGH